MRKHIVLVAALAALTVEPAVAGRTCTEHAPLVAEISKAFDLAARTVTVLDGTGAQATLVARVGQDLSKYGLRFSHFGIAWRDHPDGRWSVVHKLNECASSRANVYAEGLGNFFADDMFAYETWILVPTDAVQERLVAFLARDSGRSFHRPHYSLVSYPFSMKYQNSNAWALELLAGALSEDDTVKDSATAQAWLKANGYTPTRLSIDPITRLGGRVFRANIAFDDHPPALRWTNRIDTVTVESAYEFAQRRKGIVQSIVIRLGDGT